MHPIQRIIRHASQPDTKLYFIDYYLKSCSEGRERRTKSKNKYAVPVKIEETGEKKDAEVLLN